MVAALVGLLHARHQRLRMRAERPLVLEEVRASLPSAARLEPERGPRGGVVVRDAGGRRIGHAVRTSPVSDRVPGYRGPTDLLVVFDEAFVVRDVRIRDSAETREHVDDIRSHPSFLAGWKGRTWGEIAAADTDVDGVSGATQTSLAIAEGIARRLREEGTAPPAAPPFRFRIRDAVLLAVFAAGALLSFRRFQGRTWIRRGYLAAVILYLGLMTGDLLTQQLLLGWVSSGIPWTAAPGLGLLALASFLLPALSGRNVYCAQVCPFGGLQELAGLASGRRHALPDPWRRGLRRLPPLLLLFGLLAVFFGVPVELADLEPFDAFMIRTAGAASLAWAAAGLLASAFVPRAYCRYGCPTGYLLGFVRFRGGAERFGGREGLVLVLLAAAAGVHFLGGGG